MPRRVLLKQVSHYTYDTAKEANDHEKFMLERGKVVSRNSILYEHFRSFRFVMLDTRLEN